MEVKSGFDFLSSEIFLAEGWVYHGRPDNVGAVLSKNHFKYSIFNLLVPIHLPSSMNALGKFPFLSLKSKDYLDGKDGDLHNNAIDFINTHLGFKPDKIWLQTLPRIFGYSFNPISFWFCYSTEVLIGVLCEVNNTFGDRHFYFVKFKDGIQSQPYILPKHFHVSPFFPITGNYSFEFLMADNQSDIRIKLVEFDKLKLDTRLFLNLTMLKEKNAWSLLKSYKWLTVAVVGLIHWQALKLWLRGIKFYKRPDPPKERFTL